MRRLEQCLARPRRRHGAFTRPTPSLAPPRRSVENLARHALLGENAEHPLLLSATIRVYSDVISRLCSAHALPLVILPPSALAHRCLLCPYANVVSLLCGLLATYRDEMLALRTSQKVQGQQGQHGNGLQDIPRLNAIVLDGCNTLWRNKVDGCNTPRWLQHPLAQ